MASERKIGRAVLAAAAVVVLLTIVFWVVNREKQESTPDFMGRVPTAERGGSQVDEAGEAGAPGSSRSSAPQWAEGSPSGRAVGDRSAPRGEGEGYDTPRRGLDEPSEGEIARLQRQIPLEPPPGVVEEMRRREAEAEPSQAEIDEIIRRSEAVQPTPEELDRAERAGAVEPSPERLRELREQLREFEAQTP